MTPVDRRLLRESIQSLVKLGGEFEYSIGYEMMELKQEEAVDLLAGMVEPLGYRASLVTEGRAVDLFDEGLVTMLDVEYGDKRVLVCRCVPFD